jgi:Protein of unknown function (DUF1653)
MEWTRVDDDDNRPCASAECDNTPEWHGESGDVGAVYCSACRLKIENQPPIVIVKHGHYRHKKTGRIYVVEGVARVEATLDQVVVYRGKDEVTWAAQDDDHFWTRPVEEFADGRFERVLYRNKSF